MLRRIGLTAAAMLCASTAYAADSVQVGTTNAEWPESVTSLSDGTLFIGSIGPGVVYKAAPGATTTTEFVPHQAEGPAAVLGVYADEATNTLWVCYADLAWFGGQQGQPSVLRSFDAQSGTLKQAYNFSGPSLCNDIATTADGTAYAADTVAGAVVRTKADGSIETWKADPTLGGADGLSFGPDGALYVNSVIQNKLFRIDVNADGSAGAITEIATSQPLQGPDGMRFDGDGTLWVAENAAGRVSGLKIDGANATVTPVDGTWVGPTAVTRVGDTLWVLEAKINMFGSQNDPGMFMVHPVPMP